MRLAIYVRQTVPFFCFFPLKIPVLLNLRARHNALCDYPCHVRSFP